MSLTRNSTHNFINCRENNFEVLGCYIISYIFDIVENIEFYLVLSVQYRLYSDWRYKICRPCCRK